MKQIWNYRIIAHEDGEDMFLGIHEVQYNEKGKPVSYRSEKGETVGGSSINALKWQLDNMNKCLNKPILSANGIVYGK